MNTVTRIIIIEDNAANLELMSYLLQKHGYSILSATEGSVGLNLIQNSIPDLIICDIQLPDVDGFEIIKTLKSMDPPFNQIPIIAITSYAMVGDKEKILKAGSDGYISKPIEPSAFVSQIEDYLPTTKQLRNKISPIPSSIAGSHPQKELNFSRGKVLVVDDTLQEWELSKTLLHSMRFDAILAKNVDEAILCLENHHFDFILSDFNMPEKNGLDLLKWLRSSNHAKMPFVLISSSIPCSKRDDFIKVRELDVAIFRPIEPHKFIEAIETLWKKIEGNDDG